MQGSTRSKRQAIAGAVALAAMTALCGEAGAELAFTVDPNGWPDQNRRNAAVSSMQAVVNRHNAYGDFGNHNIWAYYNAGIPTAQASYLGSIGYGGTWPNERVTLHEANHYLGSGTWGHAYDGPRAIAIIEQFDGIGARVGTDGTHFWPYGMNYDNEWSEIGAQRNIALMYAARRDWGIGSSANPSAWAATNVTLTGSDAAGESGFNFSSKWSDNTFAHPNAAYSTGAFSMRTPNGFSSWTFVGNSLTVNPGGRLLYNGWGTTGVVTINNLTVNGGTVRHDQFSQDLFQLAGNITLASTATFEAANGDIKVLGPVGGTGSLVKSGGYSLTLSGTNSYTGSTSVNAGKLVLNNVGLPSTSGVTVSSGATLNVRGSTTTGGTLASSGAIDLADGATNTLSVGGGVNLSNSTLNIELNGATSDRLSAGGAAAVSGTNTVNVLVVPGQGVAPGSSYTVLSASGGLNAANFALGGSMPASMGFMQLNLSTPTSAALMLNVTGNPTPAVAYWTGQASVTAGDSNNNWGTGPIINKSNWSTDAAGGADPLQLPGATTSVVFNAANAAGAGGTLTTRLDSAYGIGGLTFDVPAGPGISSAVLNTNGNALSVGSGGVTLASASNASATISGTGSVIVNGNQPWSNHSNARSLNISSGVSASSGATTLTFNGTGTGGVGISGVVSNGGGTLSVNFNQAGTTVVTGANTFTGGVTVGAGTVYANPGNAAGNRAFSHVSGITVNSGGTLRAGANGLFGWDGSQDRPITVNAGGTLAALGTLTTDVGVGLVTLNGGTMTTLASTATDYGSFRFDQATDKLLVTENSVVSATRVKFGNANATIEVAAGKTLNFTGTVTDTTNGGISYLNKTGAGTLSMTGANTYTGSTTVNGGTLAVGGTIAASPTATVNSGGTLAVTGTLANTTTSVNNGSLVVGGASTSTGELWIGRGSGGIGTLTVNAGGTVGANILLVGAGGSPSAIASGTGTLASGGTINTSQWFVLGQSGAAGSSGSFTVNGGTLNVHTNGAATGNLEMGTFDATLATLNVNAGSNVKLLNNALLVYGAQGNHSGTSVVNHNGGNVTFYSDNGSTVGGTGRLAMASGANPTGNYTYNLNGGTLTVPRIARENTANNPTTAFNFNGGTVKPTASTTSFMEGLTRALVRSGGAAVDTNGMDITIGQPLLHDPALGSTPDGGLTKSGTGTLTLSGVNTYTGNTAVNAGTLVLGQSFTSGSAASVAGGAALQLAPGGNRVLATKGLSVAGKLDLTDNDLIVNYTGGSPEAAVRQLVRDGRVVGSSSGIFSTPGAPDDDKVLAVADNAQWGKSSFDGINIDTTTVVGKYTFFGDANLDGKVTGDDYVSVDANLGTGDSWLEGDFNMNGVTTGDDYVAIDANLGKGTPNPLAFAQMKAEMVALHVEMFGEEYIVKLALAESEGFGASVVPEPATISFIGLGAVGLWADGGGGVVETMKLLMEVR